MCRGWDFIENIKEGDDVLTLNIETNKIEIQPVMRKIEREHNGQLIHIKGEFIDDIVTEEHGYPLYKDGKFYGFYTAKNIIDNDIPNNENIYIPSFKECNFIDELVVTKEMYSGKVMCIEVPNHTWYVMQNGKSHWTKNCNHPDSTAIDVGRICLNITELHWEGKTLVGQMEIPITEAFRTTGAITCLADQVAHFLLNGLKLGVSSRGIGNVEQKYGTTIVTDYELICWDLVSQPSTPGAWIGETPESLQPYMESEVKNNSKLLTDLNKFQKWLD